MKPVKNTTAGVKIGGLFDSIPQNGRIVHPSTVKVERIRGSRVHYVYVKGYRGDGYYERPLDQFLSCVTPHM